MSIALAIVCHQSRPLEGEKLWLSLPCIRYRRSMASKVRRRPSDQLNSKTVEVSLRHQNRSNDGRPCWLLHTLDRSYVSVVELGVPATTFMDLIPGLSSPSRPPRRPLTSGPDFNYSNVPKKCSSERPLSYKPMQRSINDPPRLACPMNEWKRTTLEALLPRRAATHKRTIIKSLRN
ncbi:hypothetical protein GWK47_013124 [Chionoecetes opilio]|uniref:Uncharacterized protein n=1 Tax=Chionoecetes opilio TaxID=41210 RepID=A0A8J5CLL9_CHIOP|nr:hypothetical protein GWK47_013124 [Chionoecetes opilio]